jgi:hypothetical protein
MKLFARERPATDRNPPTTMKVGRSTAMKSTNALKPRMMSSAGWSPSQPGVA